MKPILTAIILFCASSLYAQGETDSLYLQQTLDSGIVNYDKDNYEEALVHLNKILVHEHATPHFQGMANYYVGYCYNYMDQPDSVLKFVTLSIPYFQMSKDTTMLAKSYYMLGFKYLILGNYDASLENTQNAYLTYASLPDTAGMIKSLIWTSILYHDSRQYELGIEYGEKALNLVKKANLPNANEEQRALNSIAINYDDRGDYDMAIAYHKKVIALKDQLSDTLRLAPTYNNIGNSYMKNNDYRTANYYFLKSLKIDEIRQNRYSLATVYTNLGTVAYHDRNFSKAKIYLDSAERISYEIMDAEKIQDVLFQQYEFNKRVGKLSSAIDYLNSFYEMKDSLLNIEKVNALNELETRYKTREKESEIARQTETIKTQKVLIRQNLMINIGLALVLALLVLLGYLYRNRLKKKQQLALQQKEIEFKEAQLNSVINTQEKERARFATDLHDSFGQTISILKMNIDSAKKLNEGEEGREQLFEESTRMLNEMYDELRGICFNLMPTTLINYGLVEAVSELAKRINTSGQVKIEVSNYGMESRLENIFEISLYRIVQEWVNNTLKYGNASLIAVQFTTDDNELTLTIEDDGPGFDKAKLEDSKGNGWKNINSRVHLLGGTVDVDTTNGVAGSILIINVPLSNKSLRADT